MATVEQSLIRVVDGEIIVAEELRITLANLQNMAQGIVVHDHDSCEEAEVVVKIRNDSVRQIKAIAEPERLRLDNAKKELLAQRDKLIAEFTAVTAPLETAARAWRIQENERAAKDAAKQNRGKAPEEHVEVKPSVPTGSGFRTRYRAEVHDSDAFLRAFIRARGAELKFFRQFVVVSEGELQSYFAEVKDVEKFPFKIPGVRFYKE